MGDVHPKHATFFPAASKSLRGSVWGRRKGRLVSEQHAREGGKLRQAALL